MLPNPKIMGSIPYPLKQLQKKVESELPLPCGAVAPMDVVLCLAFIDYRSQQYTNGESRECLKGLLAYVIMTVAKKRYDVSCRHKRTPSSSHYWGFFSFWTVELPLGQLSLSSPSNHLQMQQPTTLASTDTRKDMISDMQTPPFCCQIGCDNAVNYITVAVLPQ